MQHFAGNAERITLVVPGASAWCRGRSAAVRAVAVQITCRPPEPLSAYPYAADCRPIEREKKPAQVVRGLESTEVVEETDVTILGLLRRTKGHLHIGPIGH